jgi:predicted amino acid racemase
MGYPHLTIDLDVIAHNARTIVALCQAQGMAVAGVTKATCGDPEVARAMLRGGVSMIADSRLGNIHRLKAAGVDAPCMLLRLPALSSVDDVVASVDVSLNSEPAVLAGLSAAAQRQGRVHDVILMVDLGDLREGIWPDELLAVTRETLRLPGIRLRGLGTNLACFAGVVPSVDNMQRFIALAEEVERQCGIELAWLSAVNSSGLELMAAEGMPRRVNHARMGEAILLGCETIWRRPWPGTRQDAFVLYAEVLEVKRKPSLPVGERGQDAFGQLPQFEDRGDRLRALLNVGREDVEVSGIAPLDPSLRVLGASSGYLVVDVTQAANEIRVGDALGFSLNYGALLAAMTSAYVNKRYLHGERSPSQP